MLNVLKSVLAILSLIVAGYTPASFAQNQEGAQNGGRHGGGHRKHAMKVCEGKSVGDKVEFKTKRGKTITAECKLVAVPKRGQRPSRQNSDSGNRDQQRPTRQN